MKRSSRRTIDDLPPPDGPTSPSRSPAAARKESASCTVRRVPG